MRNKLNCKIFFLGFQNNPYIFLKKSDLIIVPSLWEGFGNIIVEAMYFRKNIISSDCDYGPREILNYGKLGYLYKNNSLNNFLMSYRKSEYINKSKLNISYLKKFKIENIVSQYYNYLN